MTALAVPGLGREKFAAVSIREYRFSLFNRRTLLFSDVPMIVAGAILLANTAFGTIAVPKSGTGEMSGGRLLSVIGNTGFPDGIFKINGKRVSCHLL